MLKSRFYINRLLFKVSLLVNLKNELRLPENHFLFIVANICQRNKRTKTLTSFDTLNYLKGDFRGQWLVISY